MRHSRMGTLTCCAVALLGCTADLSNSTGASQNPQRVVDGDIASSASSAATGSDSVATVRRIARSLAIALADDSVRVALFNALQRSTAREGKLHSQRFLLGGVRQSRGVQSV